MRQLRHGSERLVCACAGISPAIRSVCCLQACLTASRRLPCCESFVLGRGMCVCAHLTRMAGCFCTLVRGVTGDRANVIAVVDGLCCCCCWRCLDVHDTACVCWILSVWLDTYVWLKLEHHIHPTALYEYMYKQINDIYIRTDQHIDMQM